MENILAKLLVADNNSIQEGTRELKEALKNPEVISSLCETLVSSSNPQIRQYAAVLLRKRLSKTQHWLKVNMETRTRFKEGLVQVLVKEQEKVVKRAIAQLIGTVMKLESNKEGWPEMMAFLKTWIASNVDEERGLGLFTLSVLADVASELFIPEHNYFGGALVQLLHKLDNLASPIAHLTLVCMAYFVPTSESSQVSLAYAAAAPRVLEVIRALVKGRPGDSALEAMQLLDELLDRNHPVLQVSIREIVAFCLEMAVDQSAGNDMQVKALNLLGEIIRIKKRLIVRSDLVNPILSTIFHLIGLIPNSEDQEEYFPDDEDNLTPTTCSNQVLDSMALNLPPEKFVPMLLQYIEPGVASPDPCVRKASYLAMAMISEGCADYVRTKHLEQFLRYVCQGITEPVIPVRNAALFALGQFSEHLQPEISCYAKELMPVLMEFLVVLNKSGGEGGGAGEGEVVKQGVDRMFYALEMFCENLDEALLPYLQALMQHLLPLVNQPHSVHVRELAISAIGATANAAKENMLPYFEVVMKYLQQYLTENQSEETQCLQIQAVDTVGVFARTVGENNFLPMAVESIELGLKLMNNTDDPDLRKAVYGLFASVSTVLKTNMGAYLPAILEPILNSVKSDDGIVLHHDDQENSALPGYEELSDTADEEDIDNESDVSSDDAAFTVVNSYVEEKEEACSAIKEIAVNTKQAFMPFLSASFKETTEVLRYPHDYVKKAALEASTQLAILFFDPESQQTPEAQQEALDLLIPNLSGMARTEEEVEVVGVALNCFTELLKELGPRAIQGQGHSEAILECIKDVLTHKTQCQNDMDEDWNEIEEQAEQDEVLVENAGEIVPHLGRALGPEAFSYHYNQLLPLFQALTKKKRSDAQRSFGVGIMAESMAPLGERVIAFKNTLLPLLISFSRDQNDDVRNNSIFALGEMALHGKASIYPDYPQILQALSAAVSTESHAAALDNIVAAIAKLIVSNVSAIPLDQVLPVYIQYLPLREDFEENKYIFKSFEVLYQNGADSLRNLIVPVIKICTFVIIKEQIEPENKDMVVNLLRMCNVDFPNECLSAASQMTPEEAEVLRSICTST